MFSQCHRDPTSYSDMRYFNVFCTIIRKKYSRDFANFYFMLCRCVACMKTKGKVSLDFLEREIYGEFSMKFSLLRISLGKFCISFLNRKIVSHCLGEKAFPSDKKAPTHEAFLFLFLFLFRWK